MRYRQVSIPVLLLLLLVSGCQSGSNPLPTGVFINQRDSDQLLELTLDPAQTPNKLIRISIKTGANQYFGKSVGTYTLKTQQGSGRGTFVWTKSLRDGSLRQVWFTADTGKTWTVTVKSDGSLVDSTGATWRPPATRA
jgi:hypothetical protein